jgi:phage major head subunit gpT-like protein
MTFEEWLASLGIDAATLTPDDKAAMQLAYESKTAAPPAMATAAPAVAPVVAPMAAAGAIVDLQASLTGLRNQAAAETRRIADIQAKAAGFPLIAAKAIEDGWNTDKVELEVLKASAARTRPTSFQSAQNSSENMPKVIEAAVCMPRKISNVEKQFDDRTLQAAQSQFRRGIGLKQMVLMAAAANGANVGIATQVTDGNLRELLSYACPDSRNIQASAFTALSLPGILSNVANKEILEGYMEEDAVWREIAQVKSVSDFKTVTSYRMLDDMTYEKLGPGGRIKHGKVGEESFTRAVDTYAKMAAITRQDIINDDLSAFDDMRNRIGRGGAAALNDLFWSTFLGNLGTIFTTGRTNYISGATTNLGTDGVGLGLGQKAWRQRTSPTADGSKRVSGTAKFLLVPPELETIADALYVGRNNSSVKVSDVNTFAGKYNPICAPQLSDSSITGYSTTAWYLLGDKSMGSPVVVSFLNGQETPTVESADADFSQLGIQFRGYHDFGCDLGDGYLNALMSKGAA